MNLLDYLNQKKLLKARIRGNTYSCCCPFHEDKHPSLYINLDKKLWYCFGCEAGGFITSFISRLEGISKSEVYKLLDDLEDRYRLKEVDKFQYDVSKETMFKIYIEAEHYFLPAFLKQRGLTVDDLYLYRIGLVLDDVEIRTRESKISLMGWLVFGIFDFDDIFQGIVCRSCSSKLKLFWQPGIVNKNYFWGEWLINGEKKVVIVEGIFDALFLNKHGIKAIANNGIYFSDEKINRLKQKGIEKIIVFLDPDVADLNNKLRSRLELVGFKAISVLASSDPDEISAKELATLQELWCSL